ncbi:MAG TPA: hypothetical protein PLW66_05235 [Saprospiraceae bacterium]|nr:hypothetical protein [Saprospiraceae bacterium]
MQQTKLIATLRSLSPRERSRWQAWVNSDFFNKNRRLRQLCALVLDHAPGFESPELDKPRVFTALWDAETPYDELALNNLISDLLELLHGFLAYQQSESRPLEKQLDLADALLRRDLDKSAMTVLDKTRKQLDEAPERSFYWLKTDLHWWELREALHSRQSRQAADDFLLRQADDADLLLVLEKLRLACTMLSRNTLAVAKADFAPRWLDSLLQWCVEEPLLATHPAVGAYLAVLDLLAKPGAASYARLTAVLEANEAIFPTQELATLYQYALNYCIRRINDGEPEAHREALSLYQTLLDKNLLLRDGHLSQWTYKNITTAGLRCREFGWTEQFLHRYRDYLPPADRDNAHAYNLAVLHFEQEHYAEALRALLGVEFTDFTYHLGAKIIQLKIYYLLGEQDALSALLDATAKLIRRNRSLSAYGKTANLNFLAILRHISRHKPTPARRNSAVKNMKKAALMQKIQAMQPLANKDWLLAAAL